MPVPESAVVHPLVLLSVVDHYNRVARDTKKRVVGLLLGEHSKGRVDITNSFAGREAIPFKFMRWTLPAWKSSSPLQRVHCGIHPGSFCVDVAQYISIVVMLFVSLIET